MTQFSRTGFAGGGFGCDFGMLGWCFATNMGAGSFAFGGCFGSLFGYGLGTDGMGGGGLYRLSPARLSAMYAVPPQ